MLTPTAQDVTTALEVSATAAAATVQTSNWLTVAYLAVAGLVGAVAAKYKAILSWFGTADGQKAEVLLEDAIPVVVSALSKSGHQLSPQVISGINTVLKQLPPASAPTPPPSTPTGTAAALLIGFLLLASQAMALGTISISPTAGATSISFNVNSGATYYRGIANGFQTETDGLLGGDVDINWGQYHLGGTVDLDVNSDQDGTTKYYGVAGVTGGWSFLNVEYVWRVPQGTLLLGLSGSF